MENITIGQIGLWLSLVVGLLVGYKTLKTAITDFIEEALSKQFAEINSKIDSIQKDLDEEKMENCKNYLVSFLASVERGDAIDETELERFHEEKDKYIKLNGNSYIKRKIEKLENLGKL